MELCFMMSLARLSQFLKTFKPQLDKLFFSLLSWVDPAKRRRNNNNNNNAAVSRHSDASSLPL